jgi:hypothetical protein
MQALRNQIGSLQLIIILAVVVIAAAGFVGYKVITRDGAGTNGATSSQTDAASDDPIQTTEDIDEASASLEEFDSELDPAQLDEDINSLL